MGIVIGIDIGGSTTKIVGVAGGEVIKPLFVRAQDAVTSLFGAFGKYLYENEITLPDIEKVMITGVGGAYINQPLYGLPTARADEFISDALGSRYLSGLKRMLIASMGTGTAFVRMEGASIEHVGGLGLGGGTITGLSWLLLKTRDIPRVVKMAERGDLSRIDLLLSDITSDPMPGLPLSATASNFGKMDPAATQEDIALGLLSMVLQNIGKAAIFAAQKGDIHDIVAIGNLSQLPQCSRVFRVLGDMFDVNFIIPPYAEYGTAVGAALSYTEGYVGLEIRETIRQNPE